MELVKDENNLTSPDEIKEYFKDCGHEYFEVGQGVYQDEAEVMAEVDGKFYIVNIEAECWGAKQNYGDKLYHIEEITSVEFKEITECQMKDIQNKDTNYEIETLLKRLDALRGKLL